MLITKQGSSNLGSQKMNICGCISLSHAVRSLPVLHAKTELSKDELLVLEQFETGEKVSLQTRNSPNHDFTLVTVVAKQAICLSPGYLNTFSDEQLVWLPFETEEVFECVLVTHKNDKNLLTKELVDLLQMIYREKEKHYPL